MNRPHRELIAPVPQKLPPVEPMQEFIVPAEDGDTIDVLEEDRDIEVERTTP